MRTVEVEADVPGTTLEEAFAAISQFERYADLTAAVRRVSVDDPSSSGKLLSSWEVNFRNGILRWSQEDWFDREAGTIRFTLVDGDPEHYSGRWTFAEQGRACRVRFEAEFDLGIPSLSHIIDPIAQRTLHDNVVLIMKGVLGENLRFVSSRPVSAPLARVHSDGTKSEVKDSV